MKNKKTSHHHPSYQEVIPKLKRAAGQIEGIIRMVEEERYCVDILIQFRAVMAAVRNIEASVFESHLKHCVHSAILSKDKKEVNSKIHELTTLLSRRTSI